MIGQANWTVLEAGLKAGVFQWVARQAREGIAAIERLPASAHMPLGWYLPRDVAWIWYQIVSARALAGLRQRDVAEAALLEASQKAGGYFRGRLLLEAASLHFEAEAWRECVAILGPDATCWCPSELPRDWRIAATVPLEAPTSILPGLRLAMLAAARAMECDEDGPVHSAMGALQHVSKPAASLLEVRLALRDVLQRNRLSARPTGHADGPFFSEVGAKYYASLLDLLSDLSSCDGTEPRRLYRVQARIRRQMALLQWRSMHCLWHFGHIAVAILGQPQPPMVLARARGWMGLMNELAANCAAGWVIGVAFRVGSFIESYKARHR